MRAFVDGLRDAGGAVPAGLRGARQIFLGDPMPPADACLDATFRAGLAVLVFFFWLALLPQSGAGKEEDSEDSALGTPFFGTCLHLFGGFIFYRAQQKKRHLRSCTSVALQILFEATDVLTLINLAGSEGWEIKGGISTFNYHI